MFLWLCKEIPKMSKMKRSKTFATPRCCSSDDRTAKNCENICKKSAQLRALLLAIWLKEILKCFTPSIFGHQLHNSLNHLSEIMLASTLRMRLMRDGRCEIQSGSSDLGVLKKWKKRRTAKMQSRWIIQIHAGCCILQDKSTR